MAVPAGSFDSVEDVALVRRSLDWRIVPKGVVKDDGVKVFYRDAGLVQVLALLVPWNHFTLPDWAAVKTEPVFAIIAERAVKNQLRMIDILKLSYYIM